MLSPTQAIFFSIVISMKKNYYNITKSQGLGIRVTCKYNNVLESFKNTCLVRLMRITNTSHAYMYTIDRTPHAFSSLVTIILCGQWSSASMYCRIKMQYNICQKALVTSNLPHMLVSAESGHVELLAQKSAS